MENKLETYKQNIIKYNGNENVIKNMLLAACIHDTEHNTNYCEELENWLNNEYNNKNKMQIEKKQYTETKQLGTFKNSFGYGEVTEYSFETTRNMNEESVLEVLKQNGFNVFGFVSVVKKEIDYSIEQMARVFKYVVKEVEFV